MKLIFLSLGFLFIGTHTYADLTFRGPNHHIWNTVYLNLDYSTVPDTIENVEINRAKTESSIWREAFEICGPIDLSPILIQTVDNRWAGDTFGNLEMTFECI